MKNKISASQARKRLLQIAGEIPSLVDIACGRSPLWPGLVHEARRKCGKQNCRCAKGDLHVSTVLADRSGKRQRNLPLKGNDLQLFTGMTEAYREARRARARLGKTVKEMMELFDRLEELRREKALMLHAGRIPPPEEKGSAS